MTLLAACAAAFGLLVLYDCARAAYRDGRHGEALVAAAVLLPLWAGVWWIVIAGTVQ